MTDKKEIIINTKELQESYREIINFIETNNSLPVYGATEVFPLNDRGYRLFLDKITLNEYFSRNYQEIFSACKGIKESLDIISQDYKDLIEKVGKENGN
jgi:hypothetical protein